MDYLSESLEKMAIAPADFLSREDRKMRHVNMLTGITGLVAVAFVLPAEAAFTGVAYEGFDYTTGVNVTGQGAAGNGWGGAWGGRTNGHAKVAADSLSYPSLETTGGSASLAPTGSDNIQNIRGLAEVIGDDESVAWVSFLGQKTNDGTRFWGVSLFANNTSASTWGTEKIVIGHGSGGSNWTLGGTGTTVNPAAEDQLAATELVFAVLRIQFNADADDVASLWLNPDLSAGEAGLGTPYATATQANYSFGSVRIGAGETNGGNSGVNGIIDEIRVGTSFADVSPIPEPASLSLLALGGMAMLRRRRA